MDADLQSLELSATDFCLGLQVAWQNLIDHVEAAVLDDSGTGKASMCGAVVTSQRALLVSVTLRTLAAVNLNASQAPPTSALWLGPALLVCNAAHQVHRAPSPTGITGKPPDAQCCTAPFSPTLGPTP